MGLTGTDAPETAVALRLERGDLAGAATTILGAYGPGILGFLVTIVRDGDDAAEVFSSFSEDLWKGLATFRHESSVKTWAYKLAWNAAMRFFKRVNRARTRRLRTSQVSKVPADMRALSSARRHARREDAVVKLRQQLDVDEQTLLILRLDRRMSWNEVAEVLSSDAERVDAATARKRFERIKTKLATILRRDGERDI